MKSFCLSHSGRALRNEGRPAGADRDRGFEDALEFEEGLVVEGDDVEVGGGDPRPLEAEIHGVARVVGVGLDAREALLGGGGDHLAIDHQAGGGVMVVTGDAQNFHQPYRGGGRRGGGGVVLP